MPGTNPELSPSRRGVKWIICHQAISSESVMSDFHDLSFAMVWGNIGLATTGATSLPSVLFHRELDALEARNRYCLGGDEADTFTVSVVITVHARRWSAKELARHLKRHRQFFVGGPAGKEGILLEIIPDTLKKVDGETEIWRLPA